MHFCSSRRVRRPAVQLAEDIGSPPVDVAHSAAILHSAFMWKPEAQIAKSVYPVDCPVQSSIRCSFLPSGSRSEAAQAAILPLSPPDRARQVAVLIVFLSPILKDSLQFSSMSAVSPADDTHL